MGVKGFIRTAANILFLSLLPVTALAARLPAGAEPGAEAERYREETKEKQRQLQQKRRIPAVDGTQKSVPPSGQISFVLTRVILSGVTVFAPGELANSYRSYLNKEVHWDDLQAIISAIKARYMEKGYVTTVVYFPEQDIIDGQVELKVVEGRLGTVNITGNKRFSSSLIRKYFHQKEGDVLNMNVVERDLLRLNRNPDLDVQALLTQGKENGTVDVILKAADEYPHHIGAGFDNMGTRLTGKYRPALSFRSSNLTGGNDQFFANSLYTGRSFGQSMSYLFPIGTYGTCAGLDVTAYRMKLGREFKSFDITGSSFIYDPYLLWELALSDDLEAYLRAGLEAKSIKKRLEGDTVTDDQLRIPYVGFDLLKRDPWGQTIFSPAFSWSVEDFLGASARGHPTASREGTGGSFFKYDQRLDRLQPMPKDCFLSVRTRFQAASRSLPSSEQIQLGGAFSVRGYPEGDYLADMGGNVNIDYAIPIYPIPVSWKLPAGGMSWRDCLRAVVFADAGAGNLKKTEPGEDKSKFLAGIGAGIWFQFKRDISLRLEWARHVGDAPVSGAGPSTFYITFQAET